MFWKRTRWRRNICPIFVYGVIVMVVEYAILYTNVTRAVDDNDRIVNADLDMRWMLNETMQLKFLSGISNDSHNGILTNVTSITFDRSELHLVQMKLSNCVQLGGEMLKCLEDIYRSERRDEAHSEVIKPSADAPIGQRPLPPVRKQLVKKVPPTDDPVLVEEFYQRRSEVVNEYKHGYVLTPKQGCDNETYMVILVHSLHSYDDRRRAIRATWGGAAVGRHQWPNRTISHKVKLFFMLGIHQLSSMNTAIQTESEAHGDIIQGDFIDAYVNMTLKSLLGLKYVSEYCTNARYLLKSDDDMIVNVPYLLDLVDEKQLHRSIMGPLNQGSKVFRAGKWKIDPHDFPFYYYPPYESGSAYVITNDIVQDLYNTSRYVRHIHVDDAYITGILGKIIGVNHEPQKGFAFWTDKAPKPCDVIADIKVSGTKLTPKKLELFWQDIQKESNCS